MQDLYSQSNTVPGGYNSTQIANLVNSSGLPGMDPTSPQYQAIAGNIMGYQLSDQDFAARFPQMVQARNAYQGLVNQLVGPQAQTSMTAGNNLMSAGASFLPAASTAISSGQGLVNMAPGIIQQGQNVANQALTNVALGNSGYTQGQGIVNSAQPIIQQGQPIIQQGQAFLNPAARLANRSTTIGNQDINLGQNLINGNQPIDPLVQQELMRAGLTSAANSLGGAAALGGTAGQAAVGTQLGVGAQNWINQQRQMGMQLQQTGQGLMAGTAGAAGTLAGAGTGVIGAGTGVIGAGTGVMNAGAGVMNAGTGMVNAGWGGVNAGSGMINAGSGVAGTGAGVMNAGTGILGGATGAVLGGQNIINSAAQNANQGMAVASQIFQPRQFGLTGSDLANVALSNVTGQNNMNQFLYSTKVQGAQYNNQIAGANANAAAQSQGNLISGGIGVASSAAMIGLAITCHVARACFGPLDNRLYRFRFWLMNLAPDSLRIDYLQKARLASWEIVRDPLRRIKWSAWLSRLALLAPYAPAY